VTKDELIITIQVSSSCAGNFSIIRNKTQHYRNIREQKVWFFQCIPMHELHILYQLRIHSACWFELTDSYSLSSFTLQLVRLNQYSDQPKRVSTQRHATSMMAKVMQRASICPSTTTWSYLRYLNILLFHHQKISSHTCAFEIRYSLLRSFTATTAFFPLALSLVTWLSSDMKSGLRSNLESHGEESVGCHTIWRSHEL
jgi:hypothetical protein